MIVTIVATDSAGSKGDEAMIRGAFDVLDGCRIRVLTTVRADRSWSTELPDLCGSFDEMIVPFDKIASGVNGEGPLVVPGGDVIDGTCGIVPSLSRIDAVRRCIECGDRALVFMSFRPDADQRIIDGIRQVSELREGGVTWYCRDSASKTNFETQTGLKAELFPDLAYYCRPVDLGHSVSVIESIHKAHDSGRRVIGINLCHSSFSSFHSYSEDGLSDYVSSVFSAAKEALGDPYIVMIPHDTRKWPGTWTDAEFAEYSRRYFGDQGIILHPEISYAELLKIIPELDLVITGRMHLAVTSFRSGVVPVMFTGEGESTGHRIIDKCRGMFKDRIGTDELVTTDRDSLAGALRYLERNRDRLTADLKNMNEGNSAFESTCRDSIRSNLGIVSEGRAFEPSMTFWMEAMRASLRASVDSLTATDIRADEYIHKVDSRIEQLESRNRELESRTRELELRIEESESKRFFRRKR